MWHMDDPRALRLITIGLILAALAVGYMLFTGGFSVSKSKIAQTASPSASPVHVVITTPVPVASSAGSTPQPTSAKLGSTAASVAVTDRNQGNVQRLPSTGFPVGLAIVFSVSSIISGYSLRKFPR